MAIRGKTILKNAQTGFPSTNRKEEIIDWLKYNGYTEIELRDYPSPNDLRDTRKKSYMLGRYTTKDTSWIMFYGGPGKNIYFVRTVPGTEDLISIDGNAIMFPNKNQTYSTFKGIKHRVDNGE